MDLHQQLVPAALYPQISPGQPVLPQLDELTPVTQVIGEESGAQRFIAYCDESLPRSERKSLAQVYDPGRDAVVLIGPEGDFDPQEVEAALKAGFVPVTLGDSRLRIETAAIVATTAVYLHFSS